MRILACLLCLCLSGSATAQLSECRGIWSARGQQPHVGDAFTADAVASPDKQYTVAVTEESIALTVGAQSTQLPVPVNTALMEIVWAPNSRSFAINVSEGDHAGRWQAHLFAIDGGGLPRAIALEEALKALPACASKANVALVAWLEEGQEALLVFETLTGLCQAKDSQLAVRVNLAGKVVESVTADVMRQRWASGLGCRVRP
ncbi:MAG TPA: hypothetical protein VK629_05310 [Steroidobacteraceae bacterium]|nr:hypothetical protein [Steroidobacteraceae bacterium]